MAKLIIDDLRILNLPGDVWYARDVDSALKVLGQKDSWEELWLDHDLGDKTGKEENIWPVIAAIEQRMAYRPFYFGQIFVISSNPVGAQHIKLTLDHLGYSTTILDAKPYLAGILPW